MLLYRNKALKDCHDEIDFQTEFTMDLAKESKYGHNLDVGALFHTWEHHKYDDISTYRDKSHKSIFTGKDSPVHHSPWLSAMDDSLECYLGKK